MTTTEEDEQHSSSSSGLLLLKVGHHYVFTPGGNTTAIDLPLWKSTQEGAGTTSVALLSKGTFFFVVEEKRSVFTNWFSWKVMTSNQQLGWIEISQHLWKGAYRHWFKEVTKEEYDE